MTHKQLDPIFRVYEDFFFSRAVILADKGFIHADGRISANVPDIIAELINDSLKKLVAVQEGVDISIVENLTRLRNWIPMYAQFYLCGSKIVEANNVSLKSIEEKVTTMRALTLPCESFYIHLGKQESVALEWEGSLETDEVTEWEYLTGAYIGRTPIDDNTIRLKIGFTTCREDGSVVTQNGYFTDIIGDELDMPLDEAIASAFDRKTKEAESDHSGGRMGAEIKKYRKRYLKESFDLLSRSITMLASAIQSMPSGK